MGAAVDDALMARRAFFSCAKSRLSRNCGETPNSVTAAIERDTINNKEFKT
jgi:hypothetical protein